MTSKYLLLTSMVDTYVLGNAMGFRAPEEPRGEENAEEKAVRVS